MAVQLPDNLAVSYRVGIEGVEAAPVSPRSPAAADGVQMPVRRIAENETAVPEQIEAALQPGLDRKSVV